MEAVRYSLGWFIVCLAERLAALAHQLCHAGAWCMDIKIEEDCAQCQSDDNGPTDGPWAI